MRCFLTYLLLFVSFLSYGQIQVDTSFEGANAQIFRIDNDRNEILFRPALKSNQTTRCWFYFKAWGFKKNEHLKITELNDSRNLIPTYAVYSFDNKHWHKIKGKGLTDNIFKYSIPPYRHDTIYFAAGYPYTYSMLIHYISSIAKNPFLDTTTLTFSEHNLPIPLIVITDTSSHQDKDLVWITARQHAFETPANYCTEGIINFLISKDPMAQDIRKTTIIYIVPMVDVDNVYRGASGRMQKPVDFNRDWDNNPTWRAISEITNLMETTSEVYDFRIFMDIHATFPGTDSSVFAYFNIYDKDSPHYQNLRNFWLTFSSISPFIPSEVTDYSAKNYADRYVAMHYKYIDFVTTIECDWNNTDQGQPWTPVKWHELGEDIGQSIAIYLSKNK